MNTRPFEIKGDEPQWQTIYDLLASKPHGGIVTYAELSEAIGKDIRLGRSAIYKAHNELLKRNMRAIEVVTNVGYRVVESNEQDRLAKGQHKKARRRIKQGVRLIHHANRSRLTPEERTRFDAMELTMSQHSEAIRRLETRQKRTDEALKTTARTVDITAERLERIEAALKRSGHLADENVQQAMTSPS